MAWTFFKEMEKGDKNQNTLRNCSLYKIWFKIVHKNCPIKGDGGLEPFGNITILKKAALNQSHSLLRCQVGLIKILLSKMINRPGVAGAVL